VITFLTDFGLAWGPVGVCHAVMRGLASGVEIVDLSHGIPPFAVSAGAWVLASALPYIPVGVHVAVVDPGVGTERRALALRTGRGDTLIGPDNGLLIPAAERLGGVAEARRIENRALMRPSIAPTFHGRDLFSPVAAHLHSGTPYEEVGPAEEAGRLAGPPWRRPEYGERRLLAEATLLDNFGNVRTNAETALWPLASGAPLRLRAVGGERELSAARTFGDVKPGEVFAYADSSGYVCLAVNLGSAGGRLGVGPGDALELERL
jgi:S-adenosylmethionine hydrolase